MRESDEAYWNSFLPLLMERVGSMVRKSSAKVVSPYGLTSAHSYYLIALYLHDGQTMTDLSRFLDLDPANTNRIIKALKEKGFVYDDRKSENSKKYSVFLTESGKKLTEEIMENNTDAMNALFAGVPKEKIAVIRNTMIEAFWNIDPELERYLRYDMDDPYFLQLRQFHANRDFIVMPNIDNGDDPDDEGN
jgi:DNA-binding MarR family transcriptional regulator